MSIEKFDPEWGRTIYSYNPFYKYVIPTELWKIQYYPTALSDLQSESNYFVICNHMLTD